MGDTTITNLTLLTVPENENVLALVSGSATFSIRRDDYIGDALISIENNIASGTSGSGIVVSTGSELAFLTSEYLKTPLSVSGGVLSIEISGSPLYDINLSDLYLDSSGCLTIAAGAISHSDLSGVNGNEHINHSTVSITAGEGISALGLGDITSNLTINVDCSAAPAVSKIAKLDSTGYANNLVKDLIYLKVYDYNETIQSGTDFQVFTFRPPAAYFKEGHLTIKECGASCESLTTGSLTILMKDSLGTTKTTTELTSAGGNTGNVNSSTLTAGNMLTIYTTGTVSGTGLDVWFTVGGS